MTNYIITTEGLDQIQFQTNRCAPFLPSAPLVAERQCFPKRVSRILSGGEGGAWGEGAYVVGGVLGWQERWPLQRTVRTILECILVLYISNFKIHVPLKLNDCPYSLLAYTTYFFFIFVQLEFLTIVAH